MASVAVDLPPTMRAWTHSLRGPPSKVLKLTSSAPVPRIKKDSELLIKVSHAALNPGGSIIMHFVPFIFRHSPAVPEMDFSGTVIASGPEVNNGHSVASEASVLSADNGDLVPGTEVFGSILVPEHVGGGAGALAEYAVIRSDCVVKKPSNVSFEQAAGLGIAGCTALALIHKAGLKRGDSVLINGVSGGVGTLVVQMAKKIVGESGRVVGICSGRNAEVVMGLGVDEVIDYEAHAPVTEYLAKRYGDSKLNVVIDAVGIQEIWTHCAKYLMESGSFVTMGVTFNKYTFSSIMYSVYLMMVKNELLPTWLGGIPRKYLRVTGLVNLQGLEKLAKLVENGTLKGVTDSIWEIDDVLKAYKKILSKRARGKVVVKVGRS